MSDRFYNDIEVPVLPPGSPTAPSGGFLAIYSRDGKLVTKNAAGVEVVHEPSVQAQLNIDGGNASTAFGNYLLRLDFGANGSTINPTGTS